MSPQSQVDFYLLSQKDQVTKLEYACRLLAKAYAGGFHCYVQAQSEAQIVALDELLWTFSDLSFIPHCVYRDAQNDWQQYPVQIGLQMPKHESASLMLNLDMQLSIDSPSVSRVLELVANDENEKQAARQRYKHYRQQGIEPSTHQL